MAASPFSICRKRQREGEKDDNETPLKTDGEKTPLKKARSDDSVGISRTQFVVDNTGKIDDFYELSRKELGVGGFGTVFKAKSKSARSAAERAVKSIAKKRVNLSELSREVSVMKDLDHPNIIKLYETFSDSNYIYLVLELCRGGELFDRIISVGFFSEKDAAVLMQQILRAVLYMHENKIMHGDLKPENFLLVDSGPIKTNTLKIIDFGLTQRVKPGDVLSKVTGTPTYMAPEVRARRYSLPADLWSVGVNLYILLCGAPPYHANESDPRPPSFDGEVWKYVSEDAKQLVQDLLTKMPEKRITARDSLDHVWVDKQAPKALGEALPSSMIENLTQFHSHNWLKRAALQVMAREIGETEIKAIRNAFEALDANGDGTLTMAELRDGIKQLQGSGTDSAGIDLASMDVDNSGSVDYSEFIAAALDRKAHLQEDLCWSAFRIFDRDGNGRLSREELAQVLGHSSMEHAVCKEHVDDIMKEADLNGDGEIDFQEFMCMMSSTRR